MDDPGVTQPGLIAGTSAYMSPEQANGAPVDHRSESSGGNSRWPGCRPIKRLGFDHRPDRNEFLRSFAGLEVINDKPAAEFWNGVEKK